MTVFIEWRRLFFHLAGAAEVGEIVLPQGFIGEDGHGVAEVQAPGVRYRAVGARYD